MVMAMLRGQCRSFETSDQKIELNGSRATTGATFLNVIREETVDVYNTLSWAEEEINLKIGKVLERFGAFCNPRKNTSKSNDHYVIVLKSLSNTREFRDLRESL